KLQDVEVSGGLALDGFEALRNNSKKPLVQAGKSEESLLVQVVTTREEEKRMPLGAKPLPEEAIKVIRRWIDAGAREGERPEPPRTTAPATPTPRSRKLNVILPTNAVPPKGLLGPANAAKLELSMAVGPLAPVTALTFSPDGRVLAVGSYGRVTLWDLE